MRLPLTLGPDWNAASKAERYQLLWVLQGTAGRIEDFPAGVQAVLDWPLNGGMKAIICVSVVCLCRLGTALW